MMMRHAPGQPATRSSGAMSRSLEQLLLYGPRPRPPIGGPYHPNAVVKMEAEAQERVRRIHRLMNIRQAQKDVAAMERRLEATRESLTTMQHGVGAEDRRALAQFKSPAAPVLPAFLERRRRELLSRRAATATMDTVSVVTVRTASRREVSTSVMMRSTSRPVTTTSSESSTEHVSRRRSRAVADPGRVKVRVLSASSSSSGGKSSGSSSRKRPVRRLPTEMTPLFLWDTRDVLQALSPKTLAATTPPREIQGDTGDAVGAEPGTPYYDSESTLLPAGMTVLSPLERLPQPLTLRLPSRARIAGCRSPASPR